MREETTIKYNISDIDEDYIDNFFRDGGPKKEKYQVRSGFNRKNQYRASTSNVKPQRETIFRSKRCMMFDGDKVKHVSLHTKPAERRYGGY